MKYGAKSFQGCPKFSDIKNQIKLLAYFLYFFEVKNKNDRVLAKSTSYPWLSKFSTLIRFLKSENLWSETRKILRIFKRKENKYNKVIKLREYLILRLEKKNVFRVLNSAIWWLQNISRVLNFVILVKIRNESVIEYQFFFCESM